ncbi:MAG: tetratricopeptide repeat protein [bacterium]|nr:tetratricopeptide repeat protein [bacterium]
MRHERTIRGEMVSAPLRDQRHTARRRLSQLLKGRGSLDLPEAALLIAAEEYPELDVEYELKRIHLISAEGARRVYNLANPFARLDGLRTYLFEELDFRGNVDNYNDPRNCFLNDVLDSRQGIPLTLSMLFLELARAAGFEARGVGLPGHFVTRVTYAGRTILVDPYHGGAVITQDDCRLLVGRTTGRPALFRRELLDGTDSRAMLGRLLLNLKHIYVEREDYRRALSMVERMLLVAPGDPTEVRDRGFLKAHLGKAGDAIEDLETYLSLTPAAPDADSVRGRVTWLKRRLSELN